MLTLIYEKLDLMCLYEIVRKLTENHGSSSYYLKLLYRILSSLYVLSRKERPVHQE